MFGLGRSSGKIRFDGYYQSYLPSKLYNRQISSSYDKVRVQGSYFSESIDFLRFYPSGQVTAEFTTTGNLQAAYVLDDNLANLRGHFIGRYYQSGNEISARLDDGIGYQTYEGYIAQDNKLIMNWRRIYGEDNAYLPSRCFTFVSHRWRYKN